MALEQYVKHVEGEQTAEVMLYALSTCGWCRKTKGLLDELAIEYDYVYVDQLDGEPKREALDSVRALNPKTTFPTMVVNGRVIIGHREDELKEALQGGHG
jgi:glutaredoxin-like protein NrdH